MADVDVHNDGVTVVSDINGLDRINSTLNSDLTVRSDGPLRTDSTTRVTLEPLSSATTVGLDVEPVAVDSCVRVEFGRLPPTRVHTPWKHQVGFLLFGVEMFAVSFTGETTTYVEDAPHRPRVVGTTDEPAGRHTHGGVTIRVADE